MTPTGSAEVTRLFGNSVAHCYAPYDFADGVQRFLDAVRPRALVLMETEIWPNLIRLTARRNVPVALINARLSARSARGYGRIKTLISPVLRSFSWIACQYPADAQRFVALGASRAQVEVCGTIKFDVARAAVSEEQRLVLTALSNRAALGARTVWIGGSTHPGEDRVLLAAHQIVRRTIPDACLLLVPRHPERFADVFDAANAVLPSTRLTHWLADSGGADNSQAPAVVVVDAMGLLGGLYSLAQVAFIGGSLGSLGGHNPIEAAVAGVPMLMGAGRYNFASVCEIFATDGCLHLATNEQEIADQLLNLLGAEEQRAIQGRRAAALVAEHAGATERLLERLVVLA